MTSGQTHGVQVQASCTLTARRIYFYVALNESGVIASSMHTPALWLTDSCGCICAPQATGKVGLSTKALERYPGQILTEMQKVFDEAHAAAARYKEQQRELHKLQEAATQQLMRSLGMTINQTSDSREPPQESALQESRPSLWWGLNSESKLLRFLEQQLQQRKKKEALSSVLAEGAVAEPTKKEEETETEKLVHLPGGGAVLVRARRSTNQVDEEVLAAAAAEALELKMAMMQSRIPLSSNWQVPKITEGPLEDEQWDFL